MNNLKVAIPFQGFYESNISEFLEYQLEYDCFSEYSNDYDAIDWAATRLQTAKNYCDTWLSEIGLLGEFIKLESPKFYNFETDQIIVSFNSAALEQIKRMIADNKAAFVEYVRENCSDRSGFISFINPDFNSWYTDWESKHYQTALLFLDELLELESKVIEYMQCNGGFELVEHATIQ